MQPLDLTEKTLSQQLIHRGKVVTMRVDTAEQPDGKPCVREVVEHPGGVTILPILDDGRIILVEQWRYPLGQTLLELPAGKLDPGEKQNPLKAAQRELLEETGYRASHWEPMGHVFTAPGFCDEILYFYKATGLQLEMSLDIQAAHMADEDEFIHLHQVTPEELSQWIRMGKITDSKTLSLLFLSGFGCQSV